MASFDGSPNSSIPPLLIGRSYQVVMSQKIEELLASIEKSGLQNSYGLVSEFQELLQCKVDPCLESIWVYSSLSFLSSGTSEVEPIQRIVRIRDFFQLIVSSSASCNPVKSIALLAPLVYVLQNFISDLQKGFLLGSKEKKKVNREIESLLGSILGYVCVCSNAPELKSELDDFIFPLSDLVKLWSLDNGVMKTNFSFSDFFPFWGHTVGRMVAVGKLGMRELAGIVTAGLVLCKLCWKIQFNHCRVNSSDELRSWIVVSLTGFQSSYCYVALASMLLEPVFPSTLGISPKTEGLLRNVLSDALVLVEYSFLSAKSLDQLPMEEVQYIIFTRLMVAHKAVESFSEHGNQAKAISYLDNFTSSTFRIFFIGWIRSMVGGSFSDSEPRGSSPKAYLEWILDFEKRGFKIFDDDVWCSWAAFTKKEGEDKLVDHNMEPKPESDALFFIDNEGAEEQGSEEEKNISAAFMEAAHSMGHRKERRKRRSAKDEVSKKRTKLIESPSCDDNKYSSESGGEVSNPTSDEEASM